MNFIETKELLKRQLDELQEALSKHGAVDFEAMVKDEMGNIPIVNNNDKHLTKRNLFKVAMQLGLIPLDYKLYKKYTSKQLEALVKRGNAQ